MRQRLLLSLLLFLVQTLGTRIQPQQQVLMPEITEVPQLGII
jgi:hypothetical protein